jgi:hypothetical protein
MCGDGWRRCGMTEEVVELVEENRRLRVLVGELLRENEVLRAEDVGFGGGIEKDFPPGPWWVGEENRQRLRRSASPIPTHR